VDIGKSGPESLFLTFLGPGQGSEQKQFRTLISKVTGILTKAAAEINF